MLDRPRLHRVPTALTLCLSLVLPCAVGAGPAFAAAPEGAAEEGEPAPELSDEEKEEEAKKLYREAETHAKKGEWQKAQTLYEEAYYLVPGKHGFALKVGEAAFQAEDCLKALEYLVHFIRYGDPEKYADRQDEARDMLKDMLERGCVTEEELGGYHLTEDERTDRAKELYVQAEEHAANKEWGEAAKLYEQAYILVPSKHGFAHKIGMAAYKTDDCDMAHEYLVHFVEHGDPAKHAKEMDEASKIINELEISGCVTQEEMEAHQLENPFEITHEDLGDDKKRRRGGGKGLLIGGSVLAGLGLGGVGVGVAGMIMAASSQSRLDTLATDDTPSGFPDGDYACRDVPANECPPTLESQIQTRRLMGTIGLAAGGALLLTGAALIAVHFVRKPRGGEGEAEEEELVRVDGVAPMWLRGGAGAAASFRF